MKKLWSKTFTTTNQKEIKEPLSEEILFGKLKNGGTVNIKLKDKKITFLIKN